MLLRKTAWSWKSGLAVISFVLMLSVSGCSDASPEEDTVSETVIDIQAIPEDSKENAEEIINICIDLYKKAAEENKIADLETIRSIVNCLGENGYPAVDSRNQINMTDPEKVVEFCEKICKIRFTHKRRKCRCGQKLLQVRKWRYTKRGYWKLSGGVLELYRRRLPDVFRCLVFRRIVCSYIEWGRGAYRIAGTAIG